MARIRSGSASVAGIYAIRNRRTGAVYVGSTRNLRQRWTLHRSDLRAGRHSNRAFQTAWITDGPDAFVLELLQEMPLPLAAATLNAAEEAWHERMIASGTPLYSRWFRPRVEKPDSFGQPPKLPLTLRIPRSMLAELRTRADDAGQSLTALVVDIMRWSVELAERGKHPKP